MSIITEAKLNLTPIPKKRILVNIKYDSFESALRHAPHLVTAKATVVETIDSKVLNLAKEDIIWHSVSDLITEVDGKVIDGLNMVEFAGDETEVQQKLSRLVLMLDQQIVNGKGGLIGYQFTSDLTSIGKVYAMRKKAVGLLGATKGNRKPLAFAEDTAVPPENLADFIMEYRALLDGHNLQYGMFGHVDAGVLHVRPALDMCDPQDEKLLRQISDEVNALTQKYGGLMWGEHGKGVRGEYAPEVFGEELYQLQCKIKGLFDPQNRLNPGNYFHRIQNHLFMMSIAKSVVAMIDKSLSMFAKISLDVLIATVMVCVSIMRLIHQCAHHLRLQGIESSHQKGVLV